MSPIRNILFYIFLTLAQHVHGFDDNNKLIEFINKSLRPSELTILNNDANSTYQFIYTLTLPKIIVNLNTSADIKLPKNCTYIIIESNYEVLNSTLETLTAKKWNIRNNYLLLFEKITVKEMEVLFRILWQHNIYKSVIYSKNTFYTWYPYKIENNCGNNIVVVKTLRPLMERVPKTWSNCTLRLAAAKTSVQIRNPFNKTNPGPYILFFNLMARAMHANIHYLKLDENYMEKYKETGSYIPLKRIIRDGRADLGFYIGMLEDIQFRDGELKKEDLSDFERSNYIQQFWMYVVIPKVTLGYHPPVIYSTGYVSIFLAFNVMTLTLLKLSTRASFLDLEFHLIRLQLQNNSISKPKTRTEKIIFAMMMLYCIVNNCVYQTLLCSKLTIYRIRTIQTIQDMTANRIRMCHKEVGFNKYPLSLIPKQDRMFDTNLYTEQLIEKLSKTPNYAIAVADDHLGYIKNPSALLMLQPTVLQSFWWFVTPIGYPLLDTVNFWLITMREAGILEKCLSDSSRFLEQVSFDTPQEAKRSGTNWSEFYAILLCGYFLSILAFIIEMISSHCRRP